MLTLVGFIGKLVLVFLAFAVGGGFGFWFGYQGSSQKVDIGPLASGGVSAMFFGIISLILAFIYLFFYADFPPIIHIS